MPAPEFTYITDALRAKIGTPLPSTTEDRAERGWIRAFADAIGDENPLHETVFTNQRGDVVVRVRGTHVKIPSGPPTSG